MSSNLSYAVNILDLFRSVRGGPQSNKFVCTICHEEFYKDLSGEWDNITFNGNMKIEGEENGDTHIGLVWTCSDRCKTMYILQKDV